MPDQPILHTKQQRGQAAEEAAALFLKGQGYEILQRNFRTRYGEIDIIAQDGEALVFVEVRSRKQRQLGLPQETVNRQKQLKIRNMARYYLANIDQSEPVCRFDVIGIMIDLYGQVGAIELIKDAF